MPILRKMFSFIPGPYGANPNRQFVLCEVKAAAVNPVDAKWLYGDKVPELLYLVQQFLNLRICGIDFSGVVIEAPPGCCFKVGDEIFGTMPPSVGSFAETVRVPVDFINIKPKNMTFVEASAVPLVGLTTLQVFKDNQLTAGQHVLVLGASGGTGHVAVQVAKALGARVTAVCGKRNTEFVRSLGADDIVEYDVSTSTPSLSSASSSVSSSDHVMTALSQLANKHGAFHIVFDSVSSHDPRDSAWKYEERVKSTPGLLQPNSMYIIIGGLFMDWVFAHVKRYLGLNLFKRGRMLFWVRFPNAMGYLSTLKDFCESGKLKVSVGETFPLTTEGVQAAFALQMSRHVVGKIVIVVKGEK